MVYFALSDLPVETVLAILHHLDARDLLSCGTVCDMQAAVVLDD